MIRKVDINIIIIKRSLDTEVPVEELYELRKAAFQQWKDAGLCTDGTLVPIEQFERYLKDKTLFVAIDDATGELLAMRTLTLNSKKGHAAESNLSVAPHAKRQGIATRLIEEEVQWLRDKGYRYTTCSTAIPATWSVRWHLKNGYYIVGYSRSERHNYASYVFRKQLAVDLRHHPTDLLWTKPLAPITAKVRYWATYIATCICKDKAGRLNWIGRMVRPTPRPLPKGGKIR